MVLGARWRPWRIRCLPAVAAAFCLAVMPVADACQTCATYDLRLDLADACDDRTADGCLTARADSPVTLDATIILAHGVYDEAGLGVDRPLGEWDLRVEGRSVDGFEFVATPAEIHVAATDWIDAQPADGPSGRELRLTFPVSVSITPTAAVAGAGPHPVYVVVRGETDANVDGPPGGLAMAETRVRVEPPTSEPAPQDQEAPAPSVVAALLVLALAARARRLDL